MAVSVRMNPLLEKELEQVAKRQGITKSQFIVDAVERALGRKNPYELLLKVREEFAPYQLGSDSDALAASESELSQTGAAESLSTGEQFRRILQAKHEAQTRDWVEFQAAKGGQARKKAKQGTRE